MFPLQISELLLITSQNLTAESPVRESFKLLSPTPKQLQSFRIDFWNLSKIACASCDVIVPKTCHTELAGFFLVDFKSTEVLKNPAD